jgi:hypothetical protein
VQEPSGKQQAPEGCGHGFGLHTDPKPSQLVEHCASVTNVHDPSGAQHAPEGCGQTFGWQVVSSPRYIPNS